MGVNGPLGQITPGATATLGDLVNEMKNSAMIFTCSQVFVLLFWKSGIAISEEGWKTLFPEIKDRIWILDQVQDDKQIYLIFTPFFAILALRFNLKLN